MKDKKRVLIITDTYVGIPGGSERHLYNFFNGVSDRFNIIAVQLIPSLNPMLPDGYFLGRENIQLISRPIAKLLGISALKLLNELIHVIRTNDIQVVVSYHEKSDLFNCVLKLLFGKRIVSISSKRDMGFKLSSRLHWLMKKILPVFDGISCPSKSIKQLLISDFCAEEDKVFVINNGVELEHYLDSKAFDRISFIQSLSLPGDHSFISIVGCLKPIKGHKYLIQGFAQFLSKIDKQQKWTLLVLGEGELETELKALTQSLGIEENVIFAGYQTNIHEWLKLSDIAVSASLSEGLSNALVEACAAGCAIVATKVGGNPEIISNGKNGILVEEESAKQIALALLTLAENKELASELRDNAKTKAKLAFSNTIMVDRLEQLYLGTKASGVK